MEHNGIDRNELQIRTNSQKGTGTKMAEKLNNFEKFERKKNQISALFSTQRPSDALDYIARGLVDNKYTKLGKISRTLLISQGLSNMKIPLCYYHSGWKGDTKTFEVSNELLHLQQKKRVPLHLEICCSNFSKLTCMNFLRRGIVFCSLIKN